MFPSTALVKLMRELCGSSIWMSELNDQVRDAAKAAPGHASRKGKTSSLEIPLLLSLRRANRA
jgi:hypothetical protein